jgi:hypothetical protein
VWGDPLLGEWGRRESRRRLSDRVLILGDLKFPFGVKKNSQNATAIRKFLQLEKPMTICHVSKVTWKYGVLT